MKNKNNFFKDGFLVGKLNDYDGIFDFEMMTTIKEVMNSTNVYKGSRYIYEYGYDGSKINELLCYDDVQKNIGKDVDPSNRLSEKHADTLFELGHEHIVNKINDPKLMGDNNAWILGEANSDSYHIFMDDIKKQQIEFIKYYYEGYDDFVEEDFSLGNTLVQFYSKGCFIGKHNDGSPMNRIATFLYFLNEDWNEENGGQLIVNPNTSDEVVVEPTFPNFVVLDQSPNCVDNIHEVRKVNQDVKLTLTSFFEKNV